VSQLRDYVRDAEIFKEHAGTSASPHEFTRLHARPSAAERSARGLLGSIGLMTPHSPSVSSYRTILTLRLEAGTMPHDLRQSDCRMSASGREADMCEPQDEFAF
jgi:hypothetical protein